MTSQKLKFKKLLDFKIHVIFRSIIWSQRPNSRNSAVSIIYAKMISKLYTIISNKLWDLSLYFGDLYNRWVLASQVLVNARDFEQSKHIEIIVLAICWRLSAFKSPSHEKSIFLKNRSFFPFKYFQGHNWLTDYPDSEFHGHWKTVTLSSISPNLSKHWRFLAFWLSLCFGSCLLFLVCHSCSARVQWPRLADFRMLTKGKALGTRLTHFLFHACRRLSLIHIWRCRRRG